MIDDATGRSDTYICDGNTGCCATGLEIILPAGELAKLADADWSQFDMEAFRQAGGEEDDLDAQLAQIPEPFRLNATVTASVHFVVDAEPPQTTASRPDRVAGSSASSQTEGGDFYHFGLKISINGKCKNLSMHLTAPDLFTRLPRVERNPPP